MTPNRQRKNFPWREEFPLAHVAPRCPARGTVKIGHGVMADSRPQKRWNGGLTNAIGIEMSLHLIRRLTATGIRSCASDVSLLLNEASPARLTLLKPQLLVLLFGPIGPFVELLVSLIQTVQVVELVDKWKPAILGEHLTALLAGLRNEDGQRLQPPYQVMKRKMVIALQEQCVRIFPWRKKAFREIRKSGLLEINPKLLSQDPQVPPDRVLFPCRPRLFVCPPDGAQVVLVTDRAAPPVPSYPGQLLYLRRE